MEGWIKLNRGWWKDDAFRNNDDRMVFLWLLEEAQIKDKVVSIKSNPVKLKRGQLSHSLRFMGEALDMNKNKIARILEHFEKWGIIGTESGTGQNIITICNYSKYQDKRDSTETRSGTGAGQERDKLKEGKEYIYNPPIVPPLDDNKNSPMWFNGEIIRLNKSDYHKWFDNYPGTESQFEEFLSSRDDWYAEQPPEKQKSWFMATGTYIAKLKTEVA